MSRSAGSPAPTYCASGVIAPAVASGGVTAPERFLGEDLARILRRAAMLATLPGALDVADLLSVAAGQLRREGKV